MFYVARVGSVHEYRVHELIEEVILSSRPAERCRRAVATVMLGSIR